MFIDTHAHIDMKSFKNDLEDVILRAKENNVSKIINISCDIDSIFNTLELVEQFDNIYGALGIHPHDSKDYCDDIEDRLIQWLKHKKILALGEIGLDYFKMYSPKETQINVFRRQLKIAKQMEKPVIIHCRDAYEDTYEILKEFDISNGVMHCYSGSAEFAKRFMDLGFYISFTGTITFRKGDLKALKIIPIDRLLLETDCPFMTPVPHRGKRNEPSYIPLIAEKIAKVLKLDIKEVEESTTENARRLFKGL
ncbi:MAG: hydrolase TatD [Candidatus Muiribacterium halophilum]|uniref:Hydrolase TatD n=1 Tax=Muiribacterium halophilum TaxID=2053465 RepID=A0A2N5ZC50_MUIH1|nr:MAG: hydrolase TatD [Candidatus Muirbacterium halophilum]